MAHAQMGVAPEGLGGQGGQLLPAAGLLHALDLAAGLGDALGAVACGMLQPLLAAFLQQPAQVQLQFKLCLEQMEGNGLCAHMKLLAG